MPELWARDSSAINRKFKELHAVSGGANCKLKEMWARDSGAVNRKIFSGGIRWTWYTFADRDATISVESYYFTVSGYHAGSSEVATVGFNFSEPLILPKDTSIAVSIGIYKGRNVRGTLYVDGIWVFDVTSDGDTEQKSWHLVTQESVTNIEGTMRDFIPNESGGHAVMYIRITMPNTDSFYLGNAGSAVLD